MKLSIDVSIVQSEMRQRSDSDKWLVEPRLGSENGDCSKDTGLSHHAALALCRILVV